MKEQTGVDLFSFVGRATHILIPTNCQYYEDAHKHPMAIMGGGAALEAANRWPRAPKVLGQLLKSNTKMPFVPFLLETVQGPDRERGTEIIAFPTKNMVQEDSKLEIILFALGVFMSEKEMFSPREMLSPNPKRDYFIVAPRLGCGLGGLRWTNVRPYLERVCDDRWLFVTNEAQ